MFRNFQVIIILFDQFLFFLQFKSPKKNNLLIWSIIIFELLNKTLAAMPRHGNQTLINIMQKKSESTAFDSSRLMLKSFKDQGYKYNDKKF